MLTDLDHCLCSAFENLCDSDIKQFSQIFAGEDEDGKITLEEFKIYYQNFLDKMCEEKLDLKFIKNLFEECDYNHNGILDASEIQGLLKKICPHIEEEIGLQFLRQDTQMTYKAFENFILTPSPQSNYIQRQIHLSLIPFKRLFVFAKMPNHFRASKLAECSKNSKLLASNIVRPKCSDIGLMLNHCNLKTIHDTNTTNYTFELYKCTGVPSPSPASRGEIIERRVRICLFRAKTPISNVYTIKASWNENEEDVWTFGKRMMNTRSSADDWNKF
eukprot:UN24576